MVTPAKNWLLEMRVHRDLLKRDLALMFPDPADPERLAYLMKTAASLEGMNDSSILIKCSNLLLFSLIHLERQEQISTAILRRIEKPFRTVLKVLRPKAAAKFMHQVESELHDVLSQIHRRTGDHLRSAWHVGFARHTCDVGSEISRLHHLLTSANRMMRLGDLQESIRIYQELIGTAERPLKLKAQCQLIIALRLRRDFAGALARLDELDAEPLVTTPSSLKLEMQWQRMCILTQINGDWNQMQSTVRRAQSHFFPSYILEGALWEIALSRNLKVRQSYLVHSLSRHGELRSKSHPKLYDIVDTLQRALDPQVPKELRLQEVGEAIFAAPELFRLDQELLVYQAAAQVLDFLNAPALADVPRRQYGTLSLTMTQGQSNNVLGSAPPLRSV